MNERITVKTVCVCLCRDEVNAADPDGERAAGAPCFYFKPFFSPRLPPFFLSSLFPSTSARIWVHTGRIHKCDDMEENEGGGGSIELSEYSTPESTAKLPNQQGLVR